MATAASLILFVPLPNSVPSRRHHVYVKTPILHESHFLAAAAAAGRGTKLQQQHSIISTSTRRRRRTTKCNPPTTSSVNPVVLITCSSSSHKPARDSRLDKHVINQNKLRFVQKLKTLLLSKPKHFMPIHILYKCRSYLSLPKPRSLLLMIRRYPTIFELFTIPTRATTTTTTDQLCVRLTPPAASLANREVDLKKRISHSLSLKLQKLLMLSSPPHHRLLLSKLVHLAPDLGLPVNFRSRLCNDYPHLFKVVHTSYGRALELVTWDSHLANVITPPHDSSLQQQQQLIVDRPLKFKHLRLRKGLNVKRHHHDYLIKFREIPDVCPYKTSSVVVKDPACSSPIEAEKRACAVVREVLGMTVEKRTLIDHLTHFRKELGLPNKLRGMLVRHPDMFYVSLKGQRDSVFLVEGYNDKGALLVDNKDEMMMIKDEMMELVRQGKRINREMRNKNLYIVDGNTTVIDDDAYYDDSDFDDGLDDLFQLEEDCGSEDDESENLHDKEEFWMAETTPFLKNQNDCGSGPW